jgi:cation transport ATPase
VRAIRRELDDEDAADPPAHGLRQRAGQTIFWDDSGAPVTVAAPELALAEKFSGSAAILNLIRRLTAKPSPDPAVRPLVIARDRKIIGVLQFARTGERRLAQIVSGLRHANPETRFVHVSSAPQEEVEAAVEAIGFDAVYGGLSTWEKAETLRSLDVPVAWIGDGADASAGLTRSASAVSISLSGLDSLARDEADIVLLRDNVDAMLAPRNATLSHRHRLEADYRTVYAANLLAVAGGFAAGFGSLQAGLTSNLGSAAVFLGRWRALAALSADARRKAERRRRASNALAAESALANLPRRRELVPAIGEGAD